MTVGELILRLQKFRPDLEVECLWDTIPNWPIHRVEVLDRTVLKRWKRDGRVIIDCGSGEGDWETLIADEVIYE